MIVTDISSLSHNVFYENKGKFYHLNHLLLVFFSKALKEDTSKIVPCSNEQMISASESLNFYLSPTQSRLLKTLSKKPFENIVEKGENAGNQHFLLFSQCFLPIPKTICFLSYIYFVVCKCSESFNKGLAIQQILYWSKYKSFTGDSLYVV